MTNNFSDPISASPLKGDTPPANNLGSDSPGLTPDAVPAVGNENLINNPTINSDTLNKTDLPMTNAPANLNDGVLSPGNANFSNITPTDTPAIPPSDNSTFTSAPSSPHTPQKYGGAKVIATIFSVLFIVGAVVAGVTLVQRQQNLNEKAASGSECDQSPDCDLFDNPGNSGSRTVERNIVYVDITDPEYHRYNPGSNDDGCRRVNISGNTVTWERYGSGSDCKDVSNVQVWMGTQSSSPTVTVSPSPAVSVSPTPTTPPGSTPTLTPTPPANATSTLTPTQPANNITASCNEVKAYNTNGSPLSLSQLSGMEAGDTIRFAVSGQTSSGSFTKARFSVNNTSIGETTTKNSNGEYYINYVVPGGTNSFSVKGEILHSSLGWL